MGDRRRSRELALQVLYQMELGRDDAESSLKSVAANFGAPARALGYAKVLLQDIEANLAEIDRKLDQSSRRWRVERMSRVDRNILRLAACELLFRADDVPPKVAISEGVQLAKRFSGDESPAFVNAVLDTLLKSPPAGSQAPADQPPDDEDV